MRFFGILLLYPSHSTNAIYRSRRTIFPTQVSLGMKRRIAKRTQHASDEEAQSERKHSPQQQIEQEGSPNRERPPKPSGKRSD
jgi:hypothetical protein